MVERVDIFIEFLKSHVRFIFLRSPPVGVAHALEIAQLKSIPLAFPATYDPRDDTHRHVLRWLTSRAHTGCLGTAV